MQAKWALWLKLTESLINLGMLTTMQNYTDTTSVVVSIHEENNTI